MKPIPLSLRGGVARVLPRAGLFVLALACGMLRADRTVNTSVPANQTVLVSDQLGVITSGTVTVPSTSKAYFRSGKTIKLEPGFTASQGSYFHAAVSQALAIPLAWPATSGAIRYDIYRNGVYIGQTTLLTFTDTTSMTAGGSYRYEIKAVTAGGTSTAATIQAINALSLEVFTPVLE